MEFYTWLGKKSSLKQYSKNPVQVLLHFFFSQFSNGSETDKTENSTQSTSQLLTVLNKT